MEYVIKSSGVSKRFGGLEALNDASLSVGKGKVYGLVGPNGAGKTTMIRVLLGLLKPDSGSAEILGMDVSAEGDKIRSRCGVQTDTNLYEKLTVAENLDIWGRLYGLEGDALKRRSAELVRVFDLGGREKDPAGALSKGMRKKLSIARALMHEPEILFLDEPTAGLDPEASWDLLDYLDGYAAENRTVFLCSHRLDEVETLCDEVAVIDRGRVLAQGSVEELTRRIWPARRYVITLEGNAADWADRLALEGLVSSASASGTSLEMEVRSGETIPEVVKLLVSGGARVRGVSEVDHSLRDVYFKLIPREEAGWKGRR